ncbi:SPX domain-containing protein 3 [Camellia lanceoleosa]|uniref:SPX domain-containing protein 3 n=1 Tax=Camellia lanceoleosa TaxID=1840588 RepID=A0ACC0IHU8_9ERIC|nr:SPX domain-containing protein 3 [Camellia lanceoleosa]
MKFGKKLQQQIQDTLPGWRDKFLSYKDLKKIVRLISSASSMMEGSPEHGKAEEDFVYSLDNEIDKFNAFFMEQEEDFVISHKRRITKRKWGGSEKTVNFHGEMVLLMNYSNVNYTGLVKILKKYDKRTGGLLRSPYIQKVLQQTFLRTDVISKLVKECESTIDTVFPVVGEKGMREGREEIEVSSEGIFRTTIIALLTMQEIRKASSTYSHFSLPPLNLSDIDLIKFFQLYSYIIFP